MKKNKRAGEAAVGSREGGEVLRVVPVGVGESHGSVWTRVRGILDLRFERAEA